MANHDPTRQKTKTKARPRNSLVTFIGCHEIFSVPSPSHQHRHDSFILLLPRLRCPLQLPSLRSFFPPSFLPYPFIRSRFGVVVRRTSTSSGGRSRKTGQDGLPIQHKRLMRMRSAGERRRMMMKSRNGQALDCKSSCGLINTSINANAIVANAMVGPRSWIGGLISRFKRNDRFADFPFNPLQEQRLLRLQERLHVPFDETRPDHQEALTALWDAAFPNVVLQGLISDQWKEMGWQGPNPSTDFRGCGFVSLENLLFFARTYPKSFHRLLFKQGGQRATWEYPFAVAGINVTFMLIQMLDLYSDKPRCLPGFNFIKLLGENEEAFDVLYCVAFEMMDAQWLAMHASYMEFNEVLRVTRIQLERELSLEDVHCIQDLPAYNLLYR